MQSPLPHPTGSPAPAGREEDALEARLLSRIAGADQQALEELYRRYATPLYSFICRMLESREEAADVLQECFCRVWKRAATYNPARSRPFSWVVMMTRGLCLDRLRRMGTRERGLQRLLAEAASEPLNSTVDNLFFAERCVRIRRALESLADVDRRCIELSFFHGMPHPEIATTLGLPLGTVKSRLRRTLLRLRTDLGDWHHSS